MGAALSISILLLLVLLILRPLTRKRLRARARVRLRARPRARRLHPAPQRLRHAPRLRDAAAGGEGRLGVEDLADRADAGVVEVREHRLEETARAGVILGMHLQPGIDEWADQPAPDGALMIRGVA